MNRIVPLLVVLLVAAIAAAVEKDGNDFDQVDQDKQALAPLQPFVGSWKGVGQPRRGSNRGAWTEQADWAWQFADQRARLVFEAPQGKYYVAGHLRPGKEPGSFQLQATRPDEGGDDRFTGTIDPEGTLVLLRQVEDGRPGDDRPARISIRTVADGDRLVVLYERRLPGRADRYARLAEVGYTRQGGSFAKAAGQPECVVTGGLGTIEVEYDGRTWYVCCTGCRDLFQEDPEAVLADYRRRQEEK